MRGNLKIAILGVAPLLALALLSPMLAGPSVDTDGDTVFDVVDNCRLHPNKAPLDCDTDLDGYGNACDADFDQNKIVNATEFGKFVQDFKKTVDSGVGTDLDCNGIVNATDFGKYVPLFKSAKLGPSGLFCAGKVPCDL